MGKLRDFIVKFSGLSNGTHHFEFDANDRFFEQLEDSLIRSGDVKVMMTMEKKATHLELSFSLSGDVLEVCDRCAVDYPQPVSGEYRMFVKFGESLEEVDDELMTIPHGTHELDVSQMVYEFIGLSIPLRKVPCETAGDTSLCDRAVLGRISEPLTDNDTHSPFKAILGNLKDRMN
jgi:uncharacterized metal-binding protein YceD (DUF177 family)